MVEVNAKSMMQNINVKADGRRVERRRPGLGRRDAILLLGGDCLLHVTVVRGAFTLDAIESELMLYQFPTRWVNGLFSIDFESWSGSNGNCGGYRKGPV